MVVSAVQSGEYMLVVYVAELGTSRPQAVSRPYVCLFNVQNMEIQPILLP